MAKKKRETKAEREARRLALFEANGLDPNKHYPKSMWLGYKSMFHKLSFEAGRKQTKFNGSKANRRSRRSNMLAQFPGLEAYSKMDAKHIMGLVANMTEEEAEKIIDDKRVDMFTKAVARAFLRSIAKGDLRPIYRIFEYILGKPIVYKEVSKTVEDITDADRLEKAQEKLKKLIELKQKFENDDQN